MIQRATFSYLLKPLKRIGGEVVPLRMSQDILGQRREDGLKIGTLGSGSHIAVIQNRRGNVKGELLAGCTIFNNSPRRGRLSCLFSL